MLLGYSFINLNAQQISIDRMENDGKHQIMTESKNFSIDGIRFQIGMKVYETSYTKDWVLLISSYNYISNSTEVLLKLGNDEVIYLPVNNVNIGKVTMSGYGVTIGSITSISPARQVNYYSSVYELKEEDMNKIDTYGITKIRISNGVEYLDKTYKNNSLGKFLTKCRKNINKRLEHPLKSKNLFDDF
jgi:hypothetical protein